MPHRPWKTHHPTLRNGTRVPSANWFLHRAVNRGDLERLDGLHVMDCIECGSCAYGCPAGIPLVQSFRTGKKLVRDAAAREKAKKEAAAK